ncbi:transposase, partial [Pseudomonas fluorescens]|nr:transposase [Pseudomonas fluorescens]
TKHRASDVSLRLQTIPGIGVITASAITATIGDIKVFRSGRHFAAWIGLVPRQSGSGGKVHMGKISKKGDAYLRKLLVLGATAVIRYCRNKPQFAAWINALLQRRPARVVTIAVAIKMARIAWGDEPRRDVPSGSLRHRISGSGRKAKES